MAGIVVVGGGLAGLVCAWRLHRAGHDVEVLEASQHVGGRARSEVRDGVRVPVGAAFFTEGQRNVFSVATALGLADRIARLDGPGRGVPGAVLHADRFEPCLVGAAGFGLRSRLLGTGSVLRLARLAAEVVRRRDRLDPLHPERAARLEDGEAMPRFVERVVGEAAGDRLLAPLIGTLLGCEPEEVSAAYLLLTLRSLYQGAAPFGLRGGMGVLSEALAEPISVRTGCEVFSVETAPGGARVRFRGSGRERSFLADAVVLAVPGPAVPDLCASLTSDERIFFESVRYAPGISVSLATAEVPDSLPFALGFARGEDRGLRAVFQTRRESPGDDGGGRLLTVTLADWATRELAQAKDEEIVGFTLGALAKTPLAPGEVGARAVHRWAHARPVFPRGALSRLEHFRVRIARSPRIAFAGDYLVAPTVEGALTSGMQAASRVLQSLEETGLEGIRTRLCYER